MQNVILFNYLMCDDFVLIAFSFLMKIAEFCRGIAVTQSILCSFSYSDKLPLTSDY